MSRRLVGKLAWLEMKLLLREPITVVFVLLLPMVMLYVLGGIFGNEAQAGIYRGVGAMDYYIPAYLALVAASVTLISLPSHIASYRERGVLRRFRASGISGLTILGAEVAVSLGLALAAGGVLILAASPFFEFSTPQSIPLTMAGFTVVLLAFSSMGVFLGALFPTARAAQASGMLLWFLLLFLGGAGPPKEVLTVPLQAVSDWTPLWHAVVVMHHGWLGLDPGLSWLIVLGLLGASVGLASLTFRRL